MSIHYFTRCIQSTWQHWQKTIEVLPALDWEESPESLTIIMPDGRKYLFNQHTGMQQLWMASPISGGRHFSLTQKASPSTHCVQNLSYTSGHSSAFSTQKIHTPEWIQSNQETTHNQDNVNHAMDSNRYWMDTRNQEIIETILNNEFSKNWDVDLGFIPLLFPPCDRSEDQSSLDQSHYSS